MRNGSKWSEMGLCGARFKYIKYFIKLFYFKKSEQNNSNKNKLDSTQINNNKNKRNKYGFPII